MRVFFDLMWYFRQERGRYLLGITLLVIVSLLNLLPPHIVGKVVDEIRQGRLTTRELSYWLLILAVLTLVSYVIRYIWRLALYGGSTKLSRILRDRLYEHYTVLSPQFYHEHRIGDLMAHATNDIQAIEATAGDGILTLFDSLTTGILVVGTMALTINWKLTLVVLIPMPFMAWATSRYGSLLHKRFAKAQAAFSDINDRVQENISGVRVVKAFGQEEVEKESFRVLSQDVVDKNIAVAKVDALFDPTISLIVGISYFLAVAVGAVYVVHGSLSIGQLTAFTMYLGQLIWPMLAFGWLFNIVERGSASYNRVQTLLAVRPDIVDASNAVDTPPSGAIYYQIRSFTYQKASTPALSDIDVLVPRGQTLGIVGKTGSGKTTLLRLLIREFDGADGDIRFGDRSLYDYKLEALRSSIGYVPQDHFLFSTTVAGNIAFGRPESTIPEIESAARMAGIHEDIMQFPEQYNTVVGERGVTLSGGQKQRISIARALLLDAEVLILDDALSAVDARTESHILDALRAERQGRTTLIAAHRLSAVEHADEIIVLKNGDIAERGTHAELMTADGWYVAMYARQQLESLVEQGGMPE